MSTPHEYDPQLTPVAWQKFGKDYYLTGQFSMRPIFLAGRDLRLLKDGLLVPFTPDHPHAKRIVDGWNIQDAARAVIAAGRPHPKEWDMPEHPSKCPQCTAWDALKTLLEP